MIKLKCINAGNEPDNFTVGKIYLLSKEGCITNNKGYSYNKQGLNRIIPFFKGYDILFEELKDTIINDYKIY